MWTPLLLLLQRRAAPAAATPRTAPALADEAAERAGCGWFDSSHDLHHGLCVQELTSPSALARELPLPAWIDWQLAACTATHTAARP